MKHRSLNSWFVNHPFTHRINAQHVVLQTVPTPDLLSSFSLYTPPENTLESQIDEIRESLPSFPPIPDSHPHRLPSTSPPKQALSSPSITLQRTPQVQTSTPPASIKPRSAYVRKVFAGRKIEFQMPKDRRVSRRLSAVKDRRVSSGGRRNSIRFSLSLMGRPSLFGEEIENLGEGEAEVNRVHPIQPYFLASNHLCCLLFVVADPRCGPRRLNFLFN
jgi:hypothetical protein